jgi:16S rRNA (guanine527-N7)-methyltransferase
MEMFHVERDIILKWSIFSKVEINTETIDKLCRYAGLIHEANQKFNLTGLKSVSEIISELILKSIDPICDIIVPRGTRFVDLGTGAGIPGIVIALLKPEFSGLLIDSNNKKTMFLEEIIDILEIKNLNVICGRGEEIAGDLNYRDSFDWCFSRAFGKMYISVELGAGLIKKTGHMYIYSAESPSSISGIIVKHADDLGLCLLGYEDFDDLRIRHTGVCFKKVRNTPEQYPRKFAVIKREAEKIIV